MRGVLIGEFMTVFGGKLFLMNEKKYSTHIPLSLLNILYFPFSFLFLFLSCLPKRRYPSFVSIYDYQMLRSGAQRKGRGARSSGEISSLVFIYQMLRPRERGQRDGEAADPGFFFFPSHVTGLGFPAA